MPNLYLTEQNAILRKTGDRLVVEKDGEVLLQVPCLKLDTVLVYGNVQFTTQAAAQLLRHGIEMALFSRSGRLRGQLTPPKAKNVYLRVAQYERHASEPFCLEIAREIVSAKIESSAAVLRRYRQNHPEALEPAEIDALSAMATQAAKAGSLESLRGVEGTAAARYFPLLGRTAPPEVAFDGRNRRPPRDPLNALLSFGYVLVGNELQALLDGMGYDPYIGFFHQVDYGRPSLALDLLEEFRAPLVDRFSAKLFNLRVLHPEGDFVSSPRGGVFLGRESKKRYFEHYEKELETPFALDGENTTFRKLFRRQAERLARALRDEEPYQAFRYPPA